ncbi:MAG: 2-succinyl-5-enolpyruvyl-6-hydroxy-3-cyclohexene-1-carboxylic-acid synthase [Bacteroidales bacterium]|nr:2-succinyl-5-enolpyruvyl-6-hydroxy-3-cyclohexene-1-carboxylic-acid synthase [Bacteroidales bacterium]
MYSNLYYVQQLLALIKSHNVTKFVVSPGSRHIPIVISMENDPAFQLYSIVDERSASFFALGLIHKFREPVGVICTSGTACANYTSAIAEAYYQELPLLVITADRLPSFLNQLEDQTIPQSQLFKAITKLVVSLPHGRTDNDKWFTNRLINEALLELDHHGKGPVQINIPIESHIDNFECTKLPAERVIRRYTISENREFWIRRASYLRDKKILLIVGEGNPFTEEELKSINTFCTSYNAIVLADKMSNCHAEYTINSAFCVLNAINRQELSMLSPDIVIFVRANYSFNPESKGFIRRSRWPESWFVSPTGAVRDPFQNLSDIFEMEESIFFSKISEVNTIKLEQNTYGRMWKEFESTIELPQVKFGQLRAILELMRNLPNNCTLNLANSQAVRMAQLIDIDPSIEVHGNRGTDGIDGCLSAYVGFASNSLKTAFLIIRESLVQAQVGPQILRI